MDLLSRPIDQIGSILVELADLSYKPSEARETPHKYWSNENASGLVTEVEGHRVVVFTGSNDKADWRLNFDWDRYALSGLTKTIPVKVDRDALRVETTAGFMAYTALAYIGFRECEKRMGLHPLRKTIFVGHSLGSVPACLMPMIQGYEDSVSVVFGSPRFLYGTYLPERRRIHFRRLSDYVTYLPRRLRHPPMENRYIRYPGRVTGKLTPSQEAYGRYIAFVATMRGAWSQYVLGNQDAMWKGHQASGYLEDLDGLT